MGSCLLAPTTAAAAADSETPADFGGSDPHRSQLMAGHLDGLHQVSAGTSKLASFYSKEFSWAV